MEQNAEQVSDAFSKQAAVFDRLNAENKLSGYLRGLFRQEVLRQAEPGGTILELNCGTGLDAVYFAEQGFTVLATDNAPGMLAQLDRKITERSLENKIETKRISFHDLHTIKGRTFDHIISNFGGLNCTDNLQDVLVQFAPLLTEGGKVTLMIMPKICFWELILVFKGKFKTAFRRFRNGTPAHIEGVYFTCYYYNPGLVMRTLKNEVKTISLKGVCITVPPEFYSNFVERYPRLFSFMSRVDKAIGGIFPFNRCCDHYLITLQKKTT